MAKMVTKVHYKPRSPTLNCRGTQARHLNKALRHGTLAKHFIHRQNGCGSGWAWQHWTGVQRTTTRDHVVPRALMEDKVVDVEQYLDKLKWNDQGLVVAIAQDIDTGAILMQAFANREAIKATLETKLGTFYSRSRSSLWCKGESSGNFLHIKDIYVDCDSDSLIYLCKGVGPACHTGAPTCWFESIAMTEDKQTVHVAKESPYTTLQMLENTIKERQDSKDSSGKPSWTVKLLTKPELLCSKIREEAGELCETVEKDEGKERTASEMADLLYHAMVLLRTQDVAIDDVLEILRGRFGLSGIEEKASRA